LPGGVVAGGLKTDDAKRGRQGDAERQKGIDARAEGRKDAREKRRGHLEG